LVPAERSIDVRTAERGHWFVAQLPIAIAVLDRDMRYLAVSRPYLGAYDLTDVIGRSYYEVFPGTPEGVKDVHRRCLAGAVEVGEEDAASRGDDRRRRLRWTMQPWHGTGGEIDGLLITCEDILERERELQHRTEQLRRLASELTLAEQRARVQLATTLHDGLQQLLFAARLEVEGLSRTATAGTAPTNEIRGHLARCLTDAIDLTRALSIELSPPALREQGLAGALEWLAGWMRDRYGLAVRTSLDASANLDNRDIRTLVFESVRELLFNVVKHAGVLEATLELVRDGRTDIRVTVADRGAGLSAATATAHQVDLGGLGLFAIRERLTVLGGRFEIDSSPRAGTRATLVVPTRTGAAAPCSEEIAPASAELE
jgi:signal transduction histidine kinase